MKCCYKVWFDIKRKVAPYTGAWIEIVLFPSPHGCIVVAPYTGAWIEIFFMYAIQKDHICRTLHGCVD